MTNSILKKKKCNGVYIILMLVISFMAMNVEAQKISFPGAEGFGMYTTGGRGGDVYYVTNLNDSGTGSLRWAIGQNGARTIVFKVSGTIELQSNLSIKNGDVTIAGQTAPGDGICIKNFPLLIDADNIIIRFIRVRLGDDMNVENDALGGRYRKDIIVDHCSFSWATDETVSLYSCENTTIQWCIISESLKNSVHTKGTHGYGAIVGGNKASYHHNLLAHHDSRSPRIGPGLRTQTSEYVDMRNNVMYNNAGEGCYGAEAMNVNIVNNYYKPGPASNSGTKRGRIIAIDKKINLVPTDGFYPINNVWGKFYISGNIVDAAASSGNDITICNNATADNWEYGVYNQIHSKYNITDAEKQSLRVNTPFNTGLIKTDDAHAAFDKVLKWAGCSHQRDAVDTRIVNETRNGTYTYTGSISNQKGIIDTPSDVGGYPVLKSLPAPLDSDGDGMPDAWEIANNLDPNNAIDRNSYTLSSDYTNLEVYLNTLVAHIIGGEDAIIAPPLNYIYAQSSTSSLDWDVASHWQPAGIPGAIDTAIIRSGEVKLKSDFGGTVQIEPEGLFRLTANVTAPEVRLQGGTLKSFTSTPLFILTSSLIVEKPSTIWAGSQIASVFEIKGNISGSGKLAKTHTGILRLSADASAYSGNWDITAGTLQLASSSGLGTGSVVIAQGASLHIAASGIFIDSAAISGTLALNNSLTARASSIAGIPLPAGTYSAADFPAIISGTGTLTVQQCAGCPTRQAVALSPGWNLISVNVGGTEDINSVFAGLDVAEIKTMDSFWRAGQPDYLNSLQSIAAGQGYLVNMNTAGTLTVTGTHCTGVLQYAPTGWQLIGVPFQTATPISGIFGSNISVIKNFDGFWMPNEAGSSIENLEPGKGYFIKNDN
jgi:autotransporter-associated beta strand protein